VIDQFDIGRLEEASLDAAGNVELRDGTLMRAVEIIPGAARTKGKRAPDQRLHIKRMGVRRLFQPRNLDQRLSRAGSRAA